MQNKNMSLIIEGLNNQRQVNERLDKGFLNRLTKEQKHTISEYTDIDKANFKEITKGSLGNLFKKEDLMSYDNGDYTGKEILILSFNEDGSVIITLVRNEHSVSNKRPEYSYSEIVVDTSGNKKWNGFVTLNDLKSTLNNSKVSLYTDSFKYKNYKREVRDTNRKDIFKTGRPVPGIRDVSKGVELTGKDLYK